MGVLYEHWRTDTNECFYVGASWQHPDTRPYEMIKRHDDHIKVQSEIEANGGSVEVRIIECSHLSDDDLGELEILQIAYWKDLIGSKLVNIAKGGWNSLGFDWSDDMRQKNSDYMIEFYSTEEGMERKKYLSEIMIDRYNKVVSEIGVEGYSQKVSDALTRYFQTDKGLAQAKKHSETIGEVLTGFYKSPEGIKLRKKMSEDRAGEKHHAATITEETAQKILDFVGSYRDAAKQYGVSNMVAWRIRKRKTWKHLTPTNGVNETPVDCSSKSKKQWEVRRAKAALKQQVL